MAKKGQPSGANLPTSPKNIQIRERHQRALALRRGGMLYSEIAKQLGYADKKSAQRAVMAELDAQGAEDAPAVRAMEVERLDTLFMIQWAKAMRGDGWATRHCIEIMERRARLLGLDAPMRQIIEYVPDSVIDDEIRELTAKLEARARRAEGEAAPDDAEAVEGRSPAADRD